MILEKQLQDAANGTWLERTLAKEIAALQAERDRFKRLWESSKSACIAEVEGVMDAQRHYLRERQDDYERHQAYRAQVATVLRELRAQIESRRNYENELIKEAPDAPVPYERRETLDLCVEKLDAAMQSLGVAEAAEGI